MSFHKLKLISFPFISKGTRYFFSNKMRCDDIRTQHTGIILTLFPKEQPSKVI